MNKEFLDRKGDYSPFLIHLTRDSYDYSSANEKFKIPAKDVLESILKDKTLYAYNHFFPYSPSLKSQNASIIHKFQVVCFTETPLQQIGVILDKSIKRLFNPEPYGLVFTKEYIMGKGGNPTFYVTLDTAHPLWQYLYQPYVEGKKDAPDDLCKLLALFTKCEKGTDFHWEREWRIVGNLEFKLEDIYCGLCPEEDITHFERNYPSVKFISPYWGINKILDKMIQKSSPTSPYLPF